MTKARADIAPTRGAAAKVEPIGHAVSIRPGVRKLTGFRGSSGGKESACNAGDLGWEDPLEEGRATHSSLLAWRIPWTEEPGGLQSMGSQSQTGLSDGGVKNEFKAPAPSWTGKHLHPHRRQLRVLAECLSSRCGTLTSKRNRADWGETRAERAPGAVRRA